MYVWCLRWLQKRACVCVGWSRSFLGVSRSPIPPSIGGREQPSCSKSQSFVRSMGISGSHLYSTSNFRILKFPLIRLVARKKRRVSRNQSIDPHKSSEICPVKPAVYSFSVGRAGCWLRQAAQTWTIMLHMNRATSTYLGYNVSKVKITHPNFDGLYHR